MATTAKKKTKTPTAKKPRFPRRELNTWLRKNKGWSEQEWQALLADLTEAGFGYYTENQEGRDSIGLYLETNRK